MLLKDTILASPYIASACLTFLALLVCVFLERFNLINSNKRRPPRVAYWLPWVGSAIDMGKDPDAFFKQASSSLGPVFRVKSVGQEITYITSPELISTIYRDVKSFEFMPIRLEISKKIFDISHAATYSSYMAEGYLPMHHRGLSPQNIVEVLERYAHHAREHVLNAVDKLDGKGSPLVQFVVPPAYYSACRAVFGRAFDAGKSYEPFRTFDDQFHLMLAGVPKFMLPGPHRAWDQVIELFERYLEASHEDCFEIISELEMGARNAGWSLSDIAKLMGSELWALQSNAVYVVYWVLVLELRRSADLSALVAEVDSVRSEWKTKHSSQEFDAKPNQWLLDATLPRLTSVIQEALRLSTSTFSIRRVHHPIDFAGYHFEMGERLVCLTRAVHLDEEIHSKPTEFNSERYMGGNKFTKNGRPVPNHSMPFGGGVSMCEGRHFALGELKIYLGLILSHATIEIDPSTASWPRYFTSRIGVGVMPPVGDSDINVSIRKRHDV